MYSLRNMILFWKWIILKLKSNNMYTSNPFLQNIRSSSFLIRDILGSDGTLAAAGADRYGTFEQTLAPSGYPAPSGSFPAHNAPGAGNPYQSTKEFGYFSPQTFGYQDLRKGIINLKFRTYIKNAVAFFFAVIYDKCARNL